MPGRSWLKSTLVVFLLFTTMLSLSTTYLHSPVVCVEGGLVLGFPYPIFIQCYGPLLPSGGQGIGPAQFVAFGLVVDLVFWYLVSLAIWMIGLRIFVTLRRRGLPETLTTE